MKVLMATDGSVQASGAMLTASHLLQLDGGGVDILCVAPQPAAQPVGVTTDMHQAYADRLALPARRTLDDAHRILSHVHLNAHRILESGPPAERILELAPRYDLTVVGAYGGHDRRQPGLGLVSSRVLQLGAGNLMVGRELINEDNFRVLVALDSSEASLNAVRSLWTLFNPDLLDITLMHVMEMAWANPSAVPVADDADAGIDFAELGEYQTRIERELRSNATTVVGRTQEKLQRRSIPSTTIIREGDPALEITSEAENGGYDLVIAGATGASDVKHALLGSVSLKLAWDSPCSVAIIRRAP